MNKWEENISTTQRDVHTIEDKIKELESQKTMIGNQLFRLTTDEALKLMEDKLKEITKEITQLSKGKAEQEDINTSMEIVLAIVGEFLENLEFLLLESPNPLKRAAYFGVLFEETPTYTDLLSGNVRLAPYFELIDDANPSTPATVSRTGFEPVTKSLKGSCSTAELPALSLL